MWAIVVAAGRGDRFGTPKQYAPLGDRRVLDWAVDAASVACDRVVVVLPANDVNAIDVHHADAVVAGGATRAGSVRAGLAAVPAPAEVIVVHDAARPLAGADLWAAVIDAVAGGADAAIPGIPVTDTVKRVSNDRVVETLDRSELVAVQTPQAFRASALRTAHASAGEATDDAALIEAAGGHVVVVPGDPVNIKITQPFDLERAAAVLASAPSADRR